VRGLAGEYLTEGPFTEFEANLATARADGYQEVHRADTSRDETVAQRIELVHPDPSYPRLVLIQPGGRGGLSDGFTSIRSELWNKQLVIATNGQYREKDRYMAETWDTDNHANMLPPVVLGDEPGDRYPYRDGEEVVPNRPESAYVNELIFLWRMSLQRLPDRNQTEFERSLDLDPVRDVAQELRRLERIVLALGPAVMGNQAALRALVEEALRNNEQQS
jgi:hypothetical protein